MGPYEIHVFVCTSGGTCPHQGASAIHAFLKDAVLRAQLKSKVRVNHAGCLDQCGHGPMVVIYPDNVWYSHVSVEDAQVIFAQHIQGGRPVEHLRFLPPGPGAHKLARSPDGKPVERCTLCRDGRVRGDAAWSGAATEGEDARHEGGTVGEGSSDTMVQSAG